MLEDKIGALLEQKFHCSQIMMKVGMEAQIGRAHV